MVEPPSFVLFCEETQHAHNTHITNNHCLCYLQGGEEQGAPEQAKAGANGASEEQDEDEEMPDA